MARKHKALELTQSQQVYAMQSKFPQMQAKVLRQRSITWTGKWKASDLGPDYTLRIVYEQREPRPIISILSPTLTLAEGHTKLPHVYEGGQANICVHKRGEWNKGMLIADTIMPWISQWLYFYEAWALTGKWLGKGEHPTLPEHSEKRQ